MTFDTILLPPEYIEEIKARFDDQLPMRFMGMRVLQSPLARMPARQHKKRRWMSDHYHQRIQKKWNKRFGTVPAAFLMNANQVFDFIKPLPPIFVRDLTTFADNTAKLSMAT